MKRWLPLPKSDSSFLSMGADAVGPCWPPLAVAEASAAPACPTMRTNAASTASNRRAIARTLPQENRPALTWGAGLGDRSATCVETMRPRMLLGQCCRGVSLAQAHGGLRKAAWCAAAPHFAHGRCREL